MNSSAVSGVVRARRIGVPLVVIASVGLLSSCALSLQSLPKISSVGNGTYTLHAVFANVLNLPDDAQVRNGAEVIGQVSDISTENFEADLTLDIKKGVQIPVGTTAQVRFDNPLGDEYVRARIALVHICRKLHRVRRSLPEAWCSYP